MKLILQLSNRKIFSQHLLVNVNKNNLMRIPEKYQLFQIHKNLYPKCRNYKSVGRLILLPKNSPKKRYVKGKKFILKTPH